MSKFMDPGQVIPCYPHPSLLLWAPQAVCCSVAVVPPATHWRIAENSQQCCGSDAYPDLALSVNADSDLYPGFDDQKLEKNDTWKIYIFFHQKMLFTYP